MMSMKTLTSFICAIIVSFGAIAQCTPNGPNLIPNPSFENYGACPVPPCGFAPELRQNSSPCTSWRGTEQSCPMGSTPDFQRRSSVSVPTCTVGLAASNETCLSGDYCVGFFVFSTPDGSNTREYVQCQLTTTLTAGQTYCFSMVAKSRAGAAGNQLNNTNGLGAFFHNLGIIDIDVQNGASQFLGAGSTVNATPQVQASATLPHNSCTTVQGTFVATGNENYLTIGNFRTDAATTKTSTSTPSYVYIEDLKLYPINPLPVEISSFSVNCEEDYALIQWTTASEYNNSFFTIEKSCDGVNFQKIATVDGQGSSQEEINYQIKDFNLACSETSYYRLSQTDIDGRTTYLPTVSSYCEQQNSVFVSYDSQSTMLTVNSKENVQQIGIYDYAGRLVLEYSVDNKSPFSLKIPELAEGIYLVYVTTFYNRKNLQRIIVSK